MSAAAKHQVWSLEDYVLFEDASHDKHEFVDGAVRAMSGGTPRHSAIAARIVASLGTQLRGKRCVVYTSDARVRIAAANVVTYPDISVACGAAVTDPVDRNAIANPVVVVEILSPSTEGYDRGDKLAYYQASATIREIALVAQDRRSIEVWRRDDAGPWQALPAVTGGRAELTSIGAHLELDVYFDPLA